MAVFISQSQGQGRTKTNDDEEGSEVMENVSEREKEQQEREGERAGKKYLHAAGRCTLHLLNAGYAGRGSASSSPSLPSWNANAIDPSAGVGTDPMSTGAMRVTGRSSSCWGLRHIPCSRGQQARQQEESLPC